MQSSQLSLRVTESRRAYDAMSPSDANRIAKPRAPAAEETVRRQSVMKINFAPVMKTKDLHPSLGRFFGKT